MSDRVNATAERLRNVAQVDDESKVIGRHETTAADNASNTFSLWVTSRVPLGRQMVSET